MTIIKGYIVYKDLVFYLIYIFNLILYKDLLYTIKGIGLSSLCISIYKYKEYIKRVLSIKNRLYILFNPIV